MTNPPQPPDGSGDDQASLLYWVSNRAGLGDVRRHALFELLAVFRCSVRSISYHSSASGLSIYGPRPVIDYLREQLDPLVARMDTAAAAATRRYGAWLREQGIPDHAPAERRSLTRSFRRRYLRAWAGAYTNRLLAIRHGDDVHAGPAPAIGHHAADRIARHDVANAASAELHAAVVVLATTTFPPTPEPAPEPSTPAARPATVDGPGRVAPGQRVRCLPGSIPARAGGQGCGVLVRISPQTSVVNVYGDRQRRIPNQLLHPEPGPEVAAAQRELGVPTTNANGRGWLPSWAWLGWTVAEHLEYARGERSLPSPPPAPGRLVIVACGARKMPTWREVPAGELYFGSYHQAARRAAEAITTPGTRVMILSARYGLLDLTDEVLPYEQRLGQPGAISLDGLRSQARDLGVHDTPDVTVLAPAAYADLATRVWPHAKCPLRGTRGIGDQLARLAALAVGQATVADFLAVSRPAHPGQTTPQTSRASATGDESAVSTDSALTRQPCAAIAARRRSPLDRFATQIDAGRNNLDQPAAGRKAVAVTPAPVRPAPPSPPQRPAGARNGTGAGKPPSRQPHRRAPARQMPAAEAVRRRACAARPRPAGPSRRAPPYCETDGRPTVGKSDSGRPATAFRNVPANPATLSLTSADLVGANRSANRLR